MLNKLKPTIAVVDSGIGGISVLNQLIAKFHAGNYIYFADNLNMPYGNKTAKFLHNRITEIVSHLNKFFKPDLILIACNTASSVIDEAEFENVKCIQFNTKAPIFATTLTAKRLAGFNVIGAANLAKQIEQTIRTPKLKQVVKNAALRYNLNGYRELVLGCTHFELALQEFKKACPHTNFKLNSANLVERVNLDMDETKLNIKILLSKKDDTYEDKIRTLIVGSTK